MFRQVIRRLLMGVMFNNQPVMLTGVLHELTNYQLCHSSRLESEWDHREGSLLNRGRSILYDSQSTQERLDIEHCSLNKVVACTEERSPRYCEEPFRWSKSDLVIAASAMR